ncbi:MAG: uracil-DNA glycosylase family protein [Campylobacterota bacterium]|nr:uracil-DNA glycosylase family protein [Campylobacterota bacterium]
MVNNDGKYLGELIQGYKLLGYEYIDIENRSYTNSNLSTLPQDLYQLNNYIKNCNLCNLSKQKRSNSIFNNIEKKDIMVIGLIDIFDLNENCQKILKHIIENIFNFTNKDIHFTSILKCFTDKKYSVLKSEIKICIEYLYQEIKIVKPKLIIAFGDVYEILNKKDKKNSIAKIVYFNNIKLIPIYDLDYIDKNPSLKDELYVNLNSLQKKMGKI